VAKYTPDPRNPFVYDKAKYHYEASDFPSEFSIDQALVHTGFFVGWLAKNGMLVVDEWNAKAIGAFLDGTLSASKLYESLGGALIDYMLTEEGNLFARFYFDFSAGKFIGDYRELLVKDLGSDYAVRDTPDNFKIMSQRIDERYTSWKITPRAWLSSIFRKKA
jgi:hypothetical protein